jgi:hypothetical protein
MGASLKLPSLFTVQMVCSFLSAVLLHAMFAPTGAGPCVLTLPAHSVRLRLLSSTTAFALQNDAVTPQASVYVSCCAC